LGCIVLDRLGGFVFAFYILLVGSSAFAIVSAFSFSVAVINHRASAVNPRHLSRAEAQVRSAERSAKHPPVTSELLVPSASNMSAGALAKGLDEAEGHFPSRQKPRVAHRGARVAGWVRRRARSHLRSRIAKESTSRIILRSLFAQNERP
jgi:hypothetical protein